MEIWKDIEGYEGLYQVSNLGRVKSLPKPTNSRRYTEIILTQRQDTKGYLQSFLYKNGIRKAHLTHRLVAGAFLENPTKLKEVNHKDENKLNNQVSNLEFCNRKYNINYGERNKKYSKKVKQYDLQGNFIKEWNSISEASKNTIAKISNISACCRGKAKTTGGYIWRFADD